MQPGTVRAKVERLPGRTDPAARVLLDLEGTADTGQPASALFQNDSVIDVALSASVDE